MDLRGIAAGNRGVCSSAGVMPPGERMNGSRRLKAARAFFQGDTDNVKFLSQRIYKK